MIIEDQPLALPGSANICLIDFNIKDEDTFERCLCTVLPSKLGSIYPFLKSGKKDFNPVLI